MSTGSQTAIEAETLRRVLARYPELEGSATAKLPLERVSDGLINDTWWLGGEHVLQRLHPIFAAEVNLDIDALTSILRAAQVPVPRLVASRDGRPWVAHDGAVWRVMTRLAGRTIHRVERPAQARSAAALVARFHAALRDVKHRFAFVRASVHDTPAHLAALERALAEETEHRLWPEVAPLARRIETLWGDRREVGELPRRICHGDLKISNLRFSDDGDEAVGILDLDTLGRLTLDAELGDALRSWCNRGREDDAEPALDLDVFEAAMESYLDHAGEWLRPEEVAAIVPGLERITLELSARFAADALRESYFGWDPAVAPTRGEHNLLRARNQLGLARFVHQRREALDELVRHTR